MKIKGRFICILISLLIALNLFSACGHIGKSSDKHDSVSSADNSTDKVTDETTSKPSETATVPDLSFYFNTAPTNTNGEYTIYTFEGNPTEAVKKYISLLQDKYDMNLIESYEEDSTFVWRLQRASNENADVDISIDSTGGINWEMWVSLGSDVNTTAAETWDKPIVPTISGPTLPSPDAFFDNKLARNEDFYDEKHQRHTISFKADIDTGALAMQEYVSLLFDEKLNLELADEKEETILYLKQHNYSFNYVGGEDIPDVSDAYDDFKGDLLVYLQYNSRSGTSLMTFHFQPDVYEFVDFGDRTTHSPIDCSGKNTNSDTPNHSGGNNARQECDVCDGSGECQTCHGDGYLHSSASDKEDRNCYKCHPNYGKCPACHGTGWRD